MIEQARKVEHLIAQGIPVRGQFAPTVTAPIVCNTSVIAGQLCNLLFEHLNAVVLAVDKHDLGTGAIRLVVKLATVYICDGHIHRPAVSLWSWPRRLGCESSRMVFRW